MCRNYGYLATLVAISGAAAEFRVRQELKESAKTVILDRDMDILSSLSINK